MKKRILVVDDDEVVARLVTTILKSATHYDVDTSTNPYEAYARASSEPYDLLISDMRMPGLDGRQLYVCLGMDPQDCQMRVNRPKLLLMSGAVSEEVLAAAMAFVGGVSYIQKPFPPALLAAKVAAILGDIQDVAGDWMEAPEQQAAT